MFFSLPLGFSTDPARVWREGCCGFPASLPGLENIWLLREFVTREFDGIKVDLGFTAVNYPWLLGNCEEKSESVFGWGSMVVIVGTCMELSVCV